MSKPSSIREGSSSPDPFLTDVNTNGEDTPTQQVTQNEIQSAQASAATDGNAKVAKNDGPPRKAAGLETKDGGASSWGGEDMPPPPPMLRRQSTSERGAQTSAVQVSRMPYYQL